MTGPLRVLVADAAPLHRAGLRAVLTRGSGAPAHSREQQPDDGREFRNTRPDDRRRFRSTEPGDHRQVRSTEPDDRQERFPGEPGDPAEDRWRPVHDRETRDQTVVRREIVVAGEAGDGVEAVDLARRLLPDVLITDVALPRLDGLAVTRAITGARLPVPVLILTGADSDDEVAEAMSAGAAGYLRKDSPRDELLAAVHAVAAGGAVITPRVLARVLNRLSTALSALADTNALSRLTPLTAREREVLIHVARGHSNSEIAATLGVSETTVKTHVNHVLTKLRLRDRTQAVILAYETGLIHPRT